MHAATILLASATAARSLPSLFPSMVYSAMATSSGGCAAQQKERDWRRCVFADEKKFVCVSRPNRRNDVIWTDSPRTIKPLPRVAHSASINVYGAFSASGKCPLFFFSENLTARLYISI